MHMPDRVCQRMNVEYLIPFSEHHCCLFFPLFVHSLMRFKQCYFFKLRYSPAIYFSINDTAISNSQSLRSADLMFSITHLFSRPPFFWFEFHLFIQFQLFDSSELFLNFTFSLAYLRNFRYNRHKS